MRNITGLEKDLILLSKIKSKEFRKLPLKALLYLHSTFKNEKLTEINGKYVISTFMPPFPSPAYEQLIKNTVAVYYHSVFPYSTYMAFTNKCRFNCWHCSRAYRQGEELSKEKWIKVVRWLQDIGISIIGFTGGEPLLRDDLEDVIKSIDDRSTSILFTSGDGLTNERAKSLKRAGLFYMAISLDHYDKSKHNKLRGSKTAFDIAIEAINNSLKNGFYTAIQMTIRKDMLNETEMKSYVNLARDLGVQEIRIIEPMPTGSLIGEEKDIFLNEEEHEFLKKQHIKINRDKSFPKIASFTYFEDKDLYGCGAGVQHMYIDAFGNVCPCDFTPLSFGNIQEEDFDVVYNRLRNAFAVPRDKCFLLENIDKIKPFFNSTLPLEYRVSKEICNECPKSSLPKFYKALGWR